MTNEVANSDEESEKTEVNRRRQVFFDISSNEFLKNVYIKFSDKFYIQKEKVSFETEHTPDLNFGFEQNLDCSHLRKTRQSVGRDICKSLNNHTLS